MHHMVVEELLGLDALTAREAPTPRAGSGQVLLKSMAIGCNFFDILLTRGEYQQKPTLPFAPGGEVAGVVLEVGQGVTSVNVGDRVLALLDYGGYASHVLTEETRVFCMPDTLSFEHAAAMGIAHQSSYLALVERAQLRAGETLLVHAAAGGVGLAAVQIGVALGATVIGTAGSAEKCALIREQGAACALNYRESTWVDKVKAYTQGRGADVIYDPVGGDISDKSLRCIAFNGRHLVIGFASGHIPHVKMNRVLLKNIALIGLHWGAYWKHDPSAIRRTQEALFALYEKDLLHPLVCQTYPLSKATEALKAIQARRSTGKVLLTPS